jgi:hypothetical protein
VASGVVLLGGAFLVFQSGWLLALLAYGFVARVLTGPTLSPLGHVVTRVVSPRVPQRFHRQVPGPPKRFAQGIGATLTVAASVAWIAGAPTVAILLVAAVLVAATLEAAFAFCLGCVIFNQLMRWGVIPAEVCEACNDLRLRAPA